MKMIHPRTSWESCDNYVIKIHILMASDMLHIFTVKGNVGWLNRYG